ncbi:hypothetical protein [Leifsonia aquatica]|uniref:hypothetical protein n=1 Tax=Leifsonia aquatica TaxID=144185 RepID=UPI00046A9786|nr:hypothetical protein [Leifsonia aquatica]
MIAVLLIIIAVALIGLLAWVVIGAAGRAAGGRPISERQRRKLAPRIAQLEAEMEQDAILRAERDLRAQKEAERRLAAEG